MPDIMEWLGAVFFLGLVIYARQRALREAEKKSPKHGIQTLFSGKK